MICNTCGVILYPQYLHWCKPYLKEERKDMAELPTIEELQARSEEQIKNLFNSAVAGCANEFTKQLNSIYTVIAHLNKENFILRELESHLRADTITPEIRDTLLDRLNAWRTAVINNTTTTVETVQVDEPKKEEV